MAEQQSIEDKMALTFVALAILGASVGGSSIREKVEAHSLEKTIDGMQEKMPYREVVARLLPFRCVATEAPYIIAPDVAGEYHCAFYLKCAPEDSSPPLLAIVYFQRREDKGRIVLPRAQAGNMIDVDSLRRLIGRESKKRCSKSMTP